MIPSLAPYLLPHLLPELQARIPDLRLELHERQTHQLLDEVKSGSLDAAMVALPVDDKDLEVDRPCFAISFCWLCRATIRGRITR